MDIFARLNEGLRRHGFGGSLQRVLRLGLRSAMRLAYLRERHIWYRLDMASGRPRPPLPPRFDLRPASTHELELLRPLETLGLQEARRRLAGGAQLWLLREAGEAAFACWIFRGRTPVLAARGGWMPLPSGIACLEDSVTAVRCRGRGLAPAVWARVADSLAEQGFTALITKVAESNLPSRRAVEKAGFEAVARMDLVHVGPVTHVVIQPQGDPHGVAYLRTALAR